jgi:hypothetical protein
LFWLASVLTFTGEIQSSLINYLTMSEHINAVLFYLAGKNYFNGAAEINSALKGEAGSQVALDEIEAMGLVNIKAGKDNGKVYILKQFAKDGIQNLPLEFSQDPYSYFKQLDEEKQRIVAQHKDYVGNLAQKSTGLKGKSHTKIIAALAGLVATAIALLKSKRTK